MIDSAIVILYLIITVVVGITYGKKIKTIKEYSLGKGNFSIPIIVATLVATLIGGGSTLGIAEQSFRIGLIFPLAYCGMVLERFLVAYLVAPHMNQFFGAISVGEIMGRLYGRKAQILTGIATITTSVFMVGAHITAMGFLFEASMGIPRTLGLIIGTIIVLAYAPFGGINSVTFTDVFQFLCILAAIPIACAIGLYDVGGFSAIFENVPTSHLNIFLNDPKILYNHAIIFISYSIPACYPVIIQRILMSKNAIEAKKSLILTGLVSLSLFLTVGLIGLVVRVKAPDINPQQAFAFAINHILPVGIKGLVIAGLLAVMMSTMDSFLNSIGVAASYDILSNLATKTFSAQKALTITRRVVFLSAVASLISAIYFNGVLESVFASMNLWIPFIFPPLIIGIREKIKSKNSFYLGIISAASVILLLKVLDINLGLLGPILASFANFITVKISNIRSSTAATKKYPEFDVRNAINNLREKFRFYFESLENDSFQNIRHIEIISSFTLMSTILPILTSTGLMENPLTGRIYFQLLISMLCVLLILRDLWMPRFNSAIQIQIWILSLSLFFCIQPAHNLLFDSFSTLSIINFLITSVIIISITNRNPITIFLLAFSFIVALLLHRSYPSYGSAAPLLSQFVEAFIRILTMTYFFISTRNFHLSQIKAFDSMNGTMAHEIGHSIVSMKFYALRLRKTIPLLLQHYREHSGQISPERAINENDLKALDDLASRLEENASRTKNTIEIIQTKIKAGTIDCDLTDVSVMDAIQEALHAGLIGFTYPSPSIRVEGRNFTIKAERGSLVHVFINLIKNSIEALANSKDPLIVISIDSDKKVISITDNGPGISAEIISQVFNENFTTKPTGVGKGLFFCKLIIEEFGGILSCSSRPGSTSFFIDLGVKEKELI